MMDRCNNDDQYSQHIVFRKKSDLKTNFLSEISTYLARIIIVDLPVTIQLTKKEV